MDEAQDQPIYSDRPSSRFNSGLIFGLVLVVVGLVLTVTRGNGKPDLLFVGGLFAVAYSWFFTPKQFHIYQNALVIVYGRPRVKVIPLSLVSAIEKGMFAAGPLARPTGEQLRVSLVTGKQETITANNLDEFRARLEEAVARFKGTGVPSTVVDTASRIDQGPEGPAPY